MSVEDDDNEIITLGYDANFNPDIDRKYVCPICLGTMKDAMQTSCGHRFCQACIEEVSAGHPFAKCPVDNMWFRCEDELFPDIAVRREILSLPVKCYIVENGCTWEGELRDLKKHSAECEFYPVMCENGCFTELRRGDLESHRDQCELRPTRCPHCDEEVVHADIMRHQVVVCSMFPVQCTLCRQTNIKRLDIQHHLDKDIGDCPQVVVACPFLKYGCMFQDKRQNMGSHEQDSANIHLVYMERKITSQDDQLSALNQKVDDLTNTLESKVLAFTTQMEKISEMQLVSYTGQLKWKISLVPGQTVYHSKYFYTNCPGYKLHVSLEFCGHTDNSESYVSFFVTLEKGQFDDNLCFPFSAVCDAVVVGQESRSDSRLMSVHCCNVPQCRSEGETSNSKRGRLRFMLKELILSDKYCKDGNIYINVSIKDLEVCSPIVSSASNTVAINKK